MDSHASLENSKSIPEKVKAHEVRAVATLLQLFNKVDLQTVMKAGRWSNGGTFMSYFLRDFCPQADSIRKTGPVVAAGEIVVISSRGTPTYIFGKIMAKDNLNIPQGSYTSAAAEFHDFSMIFHDLHSRIP